MLLLFFLHSATAAPSPAAEPSATVCGSVHNLQLFALLRGDSEIVNSDQACVGPEPRQNCCVAPSMDRETLDHIRDRVERCRRLASQTTDERARVALLELANEGEADLRRLEEEVEKGEQDSPAIPPPQSTA